jgi:hypothetical protein
MPSRSRRTTTYSSISGLSRRSLVHQPSPPEPTSSWKAGATVEYKRTFFIPLYPYLGTASVKVGLYVPETGERLGLAGPGDGNLAYQVARIELLDQKENIFLVYKEGWHQLESQPENRNIEWQWTKKEAVCSFSNPKTDSLLYLEADTNVNATEGPQQVSIWVGQNQVDTFAIENRETILKKIFRLPPSGARIGSICGSSMDGRSFRRRKDRGRTTASWACGCTTVRRASPGHECISAAGATPRPEDVGEAFSLGGPGSLRLRRGYGGPPKLQRRRSLAQLQMHSSAAC